MRSLTIGQVAARAEIGREAIRSYECEGLIQSPPRTSLPPGRPRQVLSLGQDHGPEQARGHRPEDPGAAQDATDPAGTGGGLRGAATLGRLSDTGGSGQGIPG